MRDVARSAAFRISSTSSRRGSRRSKALSSISLQPLIVMRRVLRAWATPPASRPMASTFCHWRSCSSLLRSASSVCLLSVRSWTVERIPTIRPPPVAKDAVLDEHGEGGPVLSAECSFEGVVEGDIPAELGQGHMPRGVFLDEEVPDGFPQNVRRRMPQHLEFPAVDAADAPFGVEVVQAHGSVIVELVKPFLALAQGGLRFPRLLRGFFQF